MGGVEIPDVWRDAFRSPGTDVDQIMDACRIPTAPTRLARSAPEAASLAAGLGFPVVLKIASPDIPHKSDIGGVVMGVVDASSAAAAYTNLIEHARAACPEARLDGAHVQRQADSGADVILGAVRDPDFGPLMMFGSGGIEVEGLQDVVFELAPLSHAEAAAMIQRTWAGRKLAGFRSLPPSDQPAVVDALVKLSWLAHERADIEEIEINPLRVLGPGLGVVALDIRLKASGATGDRG
jgi:acetyltransferase